MEPPQRSAISPRRIPDQARAMGFNGAMERKTLLSPGSGDTAPGGLRAKVGREVNESGRLRRSRRRWHRPGGRALQVQLNIEGEEGRRGNFIIALELTREVRGLLETEQVGNGLDATVF